MVSPWVKVVPWLPINPASVGLIVVELALLFFNRKPTIINYQHKGKEIMKITLDHAEIDQALIDFVRKQGLNVNSADIKITVKDGQISAALATTFLTVTSSVPVTAVTNTAVPVSPAPGLPVTEVSEPVEEGDRDALKAELDKLGIEYAPKARTATLQSLLDEAHASNKKVAPQEDTSSLFGEAATVVSSEEETLPFDFDTPAAPAPEVTEEIDDDKPLFGV